MKSTKTSLSVTAALIALGCTGASAAVLEEIVVTAQKRESTLQDTAASISVITGDSIDDRNIIAITELFDVIPGVTFSEPPGGQTAFIAIYQRAL